MSLVASMLRLLAPHPSLLTVHWGQHLGLSAGQPAPHPAAHPPSRFLHHGQSTCVHFVHAIHAAHFDCVDVWLAAGMGKELWDQASERATTRRCNLSSSRAHLCLRWTSRASSANLAYTNLHRRASSVICLASYSASAQHPSTLKMASHVLVRGSIFSNSFVLSDNCFFPPRKAAQSCDNAPRILNLPLR